MTKQSLQKILRLEEELFAAEQVEQEKVELWLREQEAEIVRQYKGKLAAFDEKREHVKARAADEAQQEASVKVQGAKAQADYLDRLDAVVLRKHLAKTLKFITGQAP